MFSGYTAKQTHDGPPAPSFIRTVTVGSGISPDHAPLQERILVGCTTDREFTGAVAPVSPCPEG